MNQPPWLGTLPQGWTAQRLRHVADISNSNVDKKSYDDGQPVRLCNYTDVYYNDFITDDMELMRATATAQEIRRFQLRPGDVIITKDSESWDDIAVPACVAEELTDVVCGYHLSLFRPHAGLDGRFLLRAIQARGIREQFWTAANGVTRYGLGQQGMKDALLPIPPLPTQKAIAAFLDRKTAAIDALIEKKKKLLDLLAEKRTALINQAVTKGLDPTVPMKDSGIPWIGEIPAHWEVKRLRYILDRSLRNGLFKKKDQFGKGTALVNVGDMYSDTFQVNWSALDRVETTPAEERTFEARHGDIFFVRSSLKLEGVAASACLIRPPETTVFECHLVGARPDLSEVDPVFLVNYLNSPLVRQRLVALSTTTTMTTIAQDRIADVTVPVPPLSEGRTIAARIERIHEVLAATGANIAVQLDRLTEFRQAVITAAVTGALDVEAEG